LKQDLKNEKDWFSLRHYERPVCSIASKQMPSGLYSIPPPSGVDSLLFLTISGCTFTTGCHVKIIAAPAPYKHYQYAITISISFEYFSLSDKAVHDHQRIEEAYRLAWHMDGCVKVPVIIWVSSYSRQRWTQKSPHSLWNVGFQDITGQCRTSKWWGGVNRT